MKKIILVLFVLLISLFGVNAEQSDISILSVSLVNQDPDPATAGDTLEVRLGVENKGGESVNDLILEFVPEYPFSLLPGESAIKEVGTIGSYQYDNDVKIVKYEVRVDKDATAGSYELKIKYYEEGHSLNSMQKHLSIDIESSEGAEVIYIDKTVLVPGKEDTLMFTINNVGSAPLRELTFNWQNEDEVVLPVGGDNTKYIKYIDIGESAELKYKVIADTNAEPGLYKLDLTLTYDDPASNEEKEINTLAGVYVGGGTDFDIAFSESSGSETSFTVANIGSNPAYSVSVIVPKQDGWKTSGSNSMIIGNLDNGDYTVASFTMQQSVSRTATNADSTNKTTQTRNFATENIVLLQVAYTDTMGQRKIVDKEVAVNVQRTLSEDGTVQMPEGMQRRMKQQQSTNYTGWIVGSIVFIILGILYYRYKKKKKANPKTRLIDVFKR